MQRNWIGRSEGRSSAIRVARRRHRGLHHSARHAVRRVVHGAGARTSTRRRADERRVARRDALPLDGRVRDARRRRRRVSPTGAGQERDAAPGRDPRKDRRVRRLVRGQPDHRPTDTGVHRRLRADGLRHRRDHGRAVRRSTRLRVRPPVRSADTAHSTAARRVVRGAGNRADARHLRTGRGPTSATRRT